MAILATLHGDDRAADRHELDAKATLRPGQDTPLDILIANISATGCLFVCSTPLGVDDAISIGIAGLGRIPAQIVRAQDSRYGASFVIPLALSDIKNALALPINTVVPFPIEIVSSPVTDEASLVEKLSMRRRIVILIALVVVIWSVVVGAALLVE
jgi:hypothetical protein